MDTAYLNEMSFCHCLGARISPLRSLLLVPCYVSIRSSARRTKTRMLRRRPHPGR